MDQSEREGQVLTDDILEKNIFDLIGAQALSEEEKQKMETQMKDTIYNRAIARVDEQLPEEKQSEFKAVLDRGQTDEIEQFFQGNGVNIQQLLMEEAIIYKTELASLFAHAKTELEQASPQSTSEAQPSNE